VSKFGGKLLYETACEMIDTGSMGSVPSYKAMIYARGCIAELDAENENLKRSLGLCHYYAGCDDHVCELDGDMCTGQTIKPKEFLGK